MDPERAREARRLLDRYLVEVVERFGLCPWAAPARARGEVRIEVVDPEDAAAALDRFIADSGAAIGLVVMPDFDGGPVALRRRRDALLQARGSTIALADFHPTASLDATDAARVVPFLRRAPDPLLQAVRHLTLAGLRRSVDALSPRDQAAVLAGKAVVRPRNPVEQVAITNLTTVHAHLDALVEVLDDISRDRDHTYARLAGRSVHAGDGEQDPDHGARGW